jgi:hypothetical protein
MEILNTLLQHISPAVITLVLLGGLFAKNYMGNVNLPVAFKTLFVATLFVVVYVLTQIFFSEFDTKQIPDYFISYCVATSLYELLLKHAFHLLQQKIGNER